LRQRSVKDEKRESSQWKRTRGRWESPAFLLLQQSIVTRNTIDEMAKQKGEVQ